MSNRKAYRLGRFLFILIAAVQLGLNDHDSAQFWILVAIYFAVCYGIEVIKDQA
jgi:hypothetical protein